MAPSNSRIVRASCVLLAVFVAAVLLEHALQPDLSPSDHRISEYANGSPGWLMTGGFIAWSAALLTSAVALSNAPLRPRKAVLAIAALLLLGALGATATAAFQTGTSAGVVPPGDHLTTGNRIHDVGSGTLALALWAAVLLSIGMTDRRMRVQSAVLFGCGLLGEILFSGGVLNLPGINQRTLVAIACAWQYLLLAAIARSSRPTQSASTQREQPQTVNHRRAQDKRAFIHRRR
jgi:hypothetical protein